MDVTIDKNKALIIGEQIALQKLLEQTNGLIYQFQYFPDTNIYCFPFASKGIWNVYEITADQVKHDATPALNRLHHDDVIPVYEVMQQSMKTLKSWDHDFRVILPSKGERWLRGHGQPEKLDDGSYLWNGFINDITDQKKAALDLIESRQRWKFAIEGSQEGVWDWSLKTNKTFYSHESVAMLGYEPHEFGNTAEAWDSRVHPDDIEAYHNDIKRHFEGETPYYFNEHRVKCKDGKYKWILDRGKVIERDAIGAAIRVIGTHADITLQKEKEERARKTIDIIAEQNGRLLNFAHIVSHNLRSHSANFEMVLDLVDDTNDVDEKLKMVDHLKKVSEALSDTITHLNEIVLVQTGVNNELKKLNLSKYIEKTKDVLKGEIDKKAATVINKVPTEVFIDYNPAYLESILLNLISNGLKYKHPDRRPEIILEVVYNEQQLVLRISDNGLGIDLNKHGKNLFGMYKTFHGNEDAKGIGLFITKNQVETMGGNIKVESEVNVGTSLEIGFNQDCS